MAKSKWISVLAYPNHSPAIVRVAEIVAVIKETRMNAETKQEESFTRFYFRTGGNWMTTSTPAEEVIHLLEEAETGD